MRFNKIIEKIIVISLFVATVCSGYVFVDTIIFYDNSFAGFYTNWQFPMILAIFMDVAFYKHLNKMNN